MVRGLGLVILSGLLAAHAGRACSIPVFRYALEKWAPSKYELVIFHEGSPSAEDKARIKALREDAAAANLLVNLIDLSSNLEPDQKKLLSELEGKISEWPHCILRYPEATAKTPHVWAGPLSSPDLKTLLDSPGRKKVFDRLTMADTAAIVLLLSGDEAADSAAREFLSKHVPPIAARITLPAQTAEGPQIKSALPLAVKFTVVELDRTGPEAILARMLMNSEDGLSEEAGPIAFPVYGRGRALCSLHGDDLRKPDQLQTAMEFVCRACSCQVKELNPGVDLLIRGDWDEIFDAVRGPAPRTTAEPVIETGPAPRLIKDGEVPRITPRPAKTPMTPEARSAPPAGYEAVEVRTSRETGTNPASFKPYLLAGAACLVLLSAVWAWRSRRAVS